MTCPALTAYRARLALYRAARLPVGDMPAPDRRFADALAKLGPEHPRVVAAVGTRNALALTVSAETIRAIARRYTGIAPAEAEQVGRVGCIRAAELWTPDGGASFATYARQWIRRQLGEAARGVRVVTTPRRGAPCFVEGFERRHDGPVVLEVDDEADARLDELQRRLSRLDVGSLEAEVLRRTFGLGCDEQRPSAIADALGVTVAAVTRARTRGLALLRRVPCPRCGALFDPAGRKRYCGPACSAEARREQWRKADSARRQTRQGRRQHAARQARYRARKVTQQSLHAAQDIT